MKKLVFADLETTSLDTRTGDLWEIGIIVRDLGRPQGGDEEWWWQVRPDLRLADPNAVQVGRYYKRSLVIQKEISRGISLHCQGLRAGELASSLGVTAIAATLALTLDGATIVANNPGFDQKFLRKFLQLNGQILTASHRMIDIRTLLIGYIDGRLAAHGGKPEEAFAPEVVPYVQDWLEGAGDSPAWEIVGVHQDPADRHTALGDARLNRAVYDAIRGGR